MAYQKTLATYFNDLTDLQWVNGNDTEIWNPSVYTEIKNEQKGNILGAKQTCFQIYFLQLWAQRTAQQKTYSIWVRSVYHHKVHLGNIDYKTDDSDQKKKVNLPQKPSTEFHSFGTISYYS